MNKGTTIINLFAIQPKSIQEGQLIISSPDVSIMEQLLEKKLIETSNMFYPKSPSVNILMASLDIAKNGPNGNYKIDFNNRPTWETSCLII